jgi:hypothetical protein
MILKLITYGCGDTYEPSEFRSVENKNHMKPKGGLWASPINCNYGWREWCDDNDFGDRSTQFEIIFTGNVLVINSAADIDLLDWRDDVFYRSIVDYEKLQGRGVDAIYITEKGEQETRFLQPRDLYGYDCECVLIMNPEGIAG